MKAVIFDLDGTLIDSVPDIHAASVRLLEDRDLAPLPLAQVRSFIGNGVPKLVERVMGAAGLEPGDRALHQRMTAEFMRHYEAAPAEKTTVFDGVRPVLASLTRSGHALGVCTNKPHAATRSILAAFGLADAFGAIVGGDSLPVHKPDPAPLLRCAELLGAERAVYVGDSAVDAETSKRAGLPFAIFTEGYRNEPLESLPHDRAFSHFGELERIVAELFAQPVSA